MRELYIVDASAFLHRAFHAYPDMNRYSDDHPIAAVLGFSRMMLNLVASKEKHRPSHVAIIFDHRSKTFRHEMYSEYKANRPPSNPDLTCQFDLARKCVEKMGFAVIEKEGFEADDLIATYCEHAKSLDMGATIVSSDKDLMQLVDDDLAIRMFDPMKHEFLTSVDVVEKFGVLPPLVVDAQAMIGDTVDNIPGAPGIGAKGAASLIHAYGDLDGVIENAEKITKPATKKSIQENVEQILLSRDLVRLDRDVDLGAQGFASIPRVKFNPSEFLLFCDEIESVSLREQVEKLI